MRKRVVPFLLLLLVSLFVMVPLAAAEVTVTDYVGRTVTVPEPKLLKKVYVN